MRREYPVGNVVYVVGSDDEKFIADRVYFDFEEAKSYCDERAKESGSWLVMSAPIGADWHEWDVVYRG